ncbi:hypothetical protein KAS79_00245 [Candidatus Parcubacteria bacterium]|nr:hypothetical protein [Candidatus Parcubacteria bacterium]
MAYKSIFGWILLFAGLFVIGWGLYSSYNIFTVKTPVPEIFSLPAENNEKINNSSGNLTPEEQMQEAMDEQMEKQLGKMLPKDTLPKLLNLVAWSIFAGILIFAGGQISGTGIKLIKL